MRRVRRGFTTVELVMVIVIIGIMVTIAAPRIDVSNYRANSAMQVLGTTILTAQRQALTQQHNIVVLFDSTNRRLRVHEDRNNNSVMDTGEHVRAVPLGEGVVFGRAGAPAFGTASDPIAFTKRLGGLPALVFHRDGSASEAGAFYVTTLRAVRSGANPNDARLVVVERSTGRATSYKYLDGAWRKAF